MGAGVCVLCRHKGEVWTLRVCRCTHSGTDGSTALNLTECLPLMDGMVTGNGGSKCCFEFVQTFVLTPSVRS